MTGNEQGAAPDGPEGETGRPARRGPVIRTSDFVAPARAAPAARAVAETSPDPVEQPLASEPAVPNRLSRLAPDSANPRIFPRRMPPEPEVEVSAPPTVEPPARPKPAEAAARPPGDASAPVLDAAMVLQSAWTYRKTVAVLVIGMAILGGLASPLLPRKFTASTTLYFDPQQVKLTDGGQSASPLSQEALLAVIDSQSQILVSRRVLNRVATDLKLADDREFGGPPVAVGAKLSKAVTVERQENTYVVNLSVKAKDADKAAAIANGIVSAFTVEQETTVNGAYDTANTTLGGRLGALGEELRKSEQAVADFKAANDIDATVVTDPATGNRSKALEALVLAAQSKTIAAKAAYDAIAKFQVADLANGTTPASGASSALLQLQQQYATAASNVSSLETKLGARHPQLVAARATLEGASAAIRREITRMITTAEADYERAQTEETAVAKELSVQKALDNNLSGRLIEYRELQRKADAAREIYETVLKRTRQTSEEQRLLTSNIRVISPAEPPLAADGPGRSILLLGCIFAGLACGLILGLLYAVGRLLYSRAVATRGA
nr:GumC family protein [uncultured Gellertiella sp.]